VLSSALVGMLGAVEAHRLGSAVPEGAFAVHVTVLALVTPIFGGLYTTVGPILAAGVLATIEETFKRSLSDGYMIAYGLVLVLAILFMPRGLMGLFRGLTRRFKRGPGPPSEASARPPAAGGEETGAGARSSRLGTSSRTSAAWPPSRPSRSASRRARYSRSSAPTAPGRPRPWTSSRACSPP